VGHRPLPAAREIAAETGGAPQSSQEAEIGTARFYLLLIAVAGTDAVERGKAGVNKSFH
jgi:hypothetical protein